MFATLANRMALATLLYEPFLPSELGYPRYVALSFLPLMIGAANAVLSLYIGRVLIEEQFCLLITFLVAFGSHTHFVIGTINQMTSYLGIMLFKIKPRSSPS